MSGNRSPDPVPTVAPHAETPPGPSRRRLLRLGVLAAGGLLATTAVPLLRSGPFPPPRRPLVHLDPRRAGIVRTLGLFVIGHDHTRVPVDEVVDATLGALHESDRKLWLATLEILEAGTFAMALHLRPMSELAYEEGVAYLDSWGRSASATRRAMHMAIRKTVIASWYMDPRAWPVLGYEGPWVGRFPLPTVPLRFPLRDPVRR